MIINYINPRILGVNLNLIYNLILSSLSDVCFVEIRAGHGSVWAGFHIKL